VKPLVAFVAGALAAGVAVVLVWRPAPPVPGGQRWRARAERAERELAEARRRAEGLAARLQSSADRLDALAAEIEKRDEPPGGEVTPQARAAAPREARARTPAVAPTPEFQPVPEAQWDALVRGALESEVERRLGTALPPERLDRLVDSLRRVRELAPAEDDAGGDDSDAARRELTRSLVLLQADRAFREELGIGIADFLRGLDPEQVEEIPR
jgi:hypothetical protein